MRSCIHSCANLGASVWLLTHPTTLSFHLSLTHFLITLRTHLGLPHPIVGLPFTVLMWSHHWWSRYPFTSMPLQKWMYNNPQHILRYCCNYCFGEWSTCSEGGLPPCPHHTWQQMDTLITKDCFQTLMDIVIVDLTCTNMVQQALMTTTHAMTMVV